MVYRQSVWNTFLILFLPLSVGSQSKLFTVLGKLPCPTIQEPLWQSLLHQLSWDWSSFTATHSILTQSEQISLQAWPQVSHSRASDALTFNHSAITKYLINKITVDLDAFGELPLTEEPLQFYTLTVQTWKSLRGSISCGVSQCLSTGCATGTRALCSARGWQLLPSFFGGPASPELNLQLAHWTTCTECIPWQFCYQASHLHTSILNFAKVEAVSAKTSCKSLGSVNNLFLSPAYILNSYGLKSLHHQKLVCIKQLLDNCSPGFFFFFFRCFPSSASRVDVLRHEISTVWPLQCFVFRSASHDM